MPCGGTSFQRQLQPGQARGKAPLKNEGLITVMSVSSESYTRHLAEPILNGTSNRDKPEERRSFKIEGVEKLKHPSGRHVGFPLSHACRCCQHSPRLLLLLTQRMRPMPLLWPLPPLPIPRLCPPRCACPQSPLDGDSLAKWKRFPRVPCVYPQRGGNSS